MSRASGRSPARRARAALRLPPALLTALLLALLLVGPACGGGADDAPSGARQGERRPDATVFTWQSSDGLEIEAELRRGGEQWVLLGHQFTDSRRDWDQLVEGFTERGYR